MSDRPYLAAAEPVLIAGLGSIGRRHLANLQSLGCTRFIFYRSFKATLPDVDVVPECLTDNLNEALAHRPKIAIICNPTALHLDVALSAARAGCHLFIEKPLSHTLDHCGELAEVAARNGLVTMIGCQFRFHPLLASLRQQLRAGRLGTVRSAQAEWGEYLPDWHPWEDYKQSYSARSDLGGGVILTLIHPIDYLMWMFGEVARAVGTSEDVAELKTEVPDDSADIELTFANGLVASVHLDYLQKPAVHRLEVTGDRGRALWDYHAGTLVWEMTDGEIERERVDAAFERNTMFIDEMREFLSAVHERRASAIPLVDGIAALQVALAAKSSALEKNFLG